MSIGEPKVVTATEFSHHTADFLNQVGFRGKALTVLRYGRPFVKIEPAGSEDGDFGKESDHSDTAKD